ncbi:MAG: hypothetical protein HC833_15980 [Leptolyngbyaceae cyanobacterium RM1_406_9]|nr:hypothetical protein [Leptolyngbyaceae cyanobacterium RM1_406_9]
MSSLNHSPASIRYLKARLRILKRPAVWGSAAILLLTLFSVYTFLQRPDWLTVTESDRTSPETDLNADEGVDPNALPPEEDSAIGMDIDSLSVLREEISSFDEEAEIDLLAPPSRPSEEDGESTALRTTSSPLVSGAPQSSQSPFSSAYAQNNQPLSLNLFNSPTVLPGSSTTADAAPSGTSGSGLELGTAQTTAPTTPLRTAVEQYANSSSQPSADSQAQSTEASGDPRRQPAATPTYLPPQPLGQGQYAPRTSPAPGTTGYTVPPSLIYGGNNAYTNPASPNPVSPQAVPGLPQAPQVLPQTIPTQPGIGQPTQTPYGGGTASTPVPNVQQPQVVQPPAQPFSVPRSSAGYSIGGREVETFSNP